MFARETSEFRTTAGKAAASHQNPSSSYSRSVAESRDAGNSSDRRSGDSSRTDLRTNHEERTVGSVSVALDLKKNDGQFYVIANLIVSKYEDEIKYQHGSITLSEDDKRHFDRITSKENFVEAVQYRLKQSTLKGSTDVTLEQCRILGLHESGANNILFAPVGSKVTLHYKRNGKFTSAANMKSNSREDALARQQLVAELREASNLMADSVTPEATHFWRQQVVELQNRLKAIREQPCSSSTVVAEEEQLLKKNERMMARLDEAEEKVLNSNSTINSILAESHTTGNFGKTVEQNQGDLLAKLEREFSELQAKNDGLNNVDPEIQNVPMVDVVAPSNLPEGYTFEAEINNRRFLAMVPAGGVRKGQAFSCYMRDIDKVADIPIGKWRDTLFSLREHGIFHPMLLTSFACPILALAQVMTRMGLDFTGHPNTEVPRKGVWSTWGMAFMILGFWGTLNAMVIMAIRVKNLEHFPISGPDFLSLILINGGMMVYMVYASANTRATIRSRYSIDQDEKYRGQEDLILSAAFLPCTIAQMGRHTISYDKYEARWCSETGLAPGVEADITSRKQTGSYRVW